MTEQNSSIKPRFESLGFYAPEKSVTTDELISQMENKPLFDLERITKIRARRVRSKKESSYTIGLTAAKRCLKSSKYSASDLDIVFFCSISRYREYPKFVIEPSLSLFLKNEIGASNAMNFDISNACAGMITGAYILYNMIVAGAVKNGMVVSGECITPLAETAVIEISEPVDEQFASLTLGDAGAAYILDISPNKDEGIDFVDCLTVARFADLCFGMPSDKNPGPVMYTQASRLHKEAIKRCPIAIEEIFKRSGVEFDPDNFDYVIPHQTSERAITHADELLGDYFGKKMPPPLFSLHEYGNTSSTTHFVVLNKALRENKIKKGDRLMLVSIASGIVFGILSTTIGDLKGW